MKRIICCLFLVLILSFYLLGCGIKVTSTSPPSLPVSQRGTFPTIKVNCNSVNTIYINPTNSSINVTVQATDNCEGADPQGRGSQLSLFNATGTRIGNPVNVPDGATIATTFSVPANGTIDFFCAGQSGDCSYTISVP